MPQVSVCIPTYNGRAYLGDAIESVLRQTFSNLELVICDDASTDDTSAVCRSFHDPRLRYIRFDQNGGQAVNWNRCVDAAAGEYVVILHQDDVLAPTYLKQAVQVLDTHSDVGLVHCSVQHVDADGNAVGLQQLYSDDLIEPGEVLWRQLVIRGCVVNPAGVTIRKRVYETVGPFSTSVAWGIDWDMWIRIALRFHVAYLAATLSFYRHHPKSGTGAVAAAARNGADELWVVERTFEEVGRMRPDLLLLRKTAIRQVAHRTWCMAETMCREGFMDAARTGIRHAVRISPSMVLKRQVWGLWAATYLGYDWFSRMQQRKTSLSLRIRSATSASGRGRTRGESEC